MEGPTLQKPPITPITSIIHVIVEGILEMKTKSRETVNAKRITKSRNQHPTTGGLIRQPY